MQDTEQPERGAAGARLRRSLRGLELPAPDWIVEIVRPRPAPVPWADAARAAVVLTTPLAVGLALGQPGLGIIVTMGALPPTIADQGGPLRTRLRRGAMAGLAGAAGLLAGHLITGSGWIAVIAVAAIAFVSARISVLGATASLAGLQLLVFSAIASGLQVRLSPLVLPAVFLAGSAWALAASVLQAFVEGPRTPERTAVATVYRNIAKLLFATSTPRAAEARQALTTVMNAAYDMLLGARSRTSGRDPETRRLAALLNAATALVEPSVAIAHAGRRPPAALRDAVGDLADAILRDGPPPPPPAVGPGEGPLLRELRSGLATVSAQFTRDHTTPVAHDRGRWRARWVAAIDELVTGRSGWLFALRLVLCMSLAEVVAEVVPLGRGYWVLLTTAIVLKPDFGSVFARALQRGLGTVLGVLIGALVLVLLPHGPVLLAFLLVFAGLLPIAQRRNYGLFSAFITPVAILLIDFGARANVSIVGTRLLDTAIGCAIVLVVGYLLWPETWRVRLGGQVADAAALLADYLESAFGPDQPRRRSLRRHTYRKLSDVRTALQQMLAEPRAMRGRTVAWWPLIVQLERATDAVTEVAVHVRAGAPAPVPEDVAALTDAVRDLSEALEERRAPRLMTLPEGGGLAGIAEEVRTARRLARRHNGEPQPHARAPAGGDMRRTG